MCIAIPMHVLESDGVSALCEGRGELQRINLLMVGDCPPGSWVMAFLGYARQRIEEDDARRMNETLDGLEAALRGEPDFDKHFAGIASQ